MPHVLTGNLSLKEAEAAGDGWQCRTFQTPGMCLDLQSGRGQVTNTQPGLKEQHTATDHTVKAISIFFYADTITSTATQIHCHIKASCIFCVVYGQKKWDRDYYSFFNAAELLWWIFIHAEIGIHCKWAERTPARAKSATQPEVWLCVFAASKHTFWKKIAMMGNTNGEDRAVLMQEGGTRCLWFCPCSSLAGCPSGTWLPSASVLSMWV